jgi:hypothetical protein
MRTCIVCGTAFQPHSRQKTCSATKWSGPSRDFLSTDFAVEFSPRGEEWIFVIWGATMPTARNLAAEPPPLPQDARNGLAGYDRPEIGSAPSGGSGGDFWRVWFTPAISEPAQQRGRRR